jgi:hypothetical protein
MNASSIVSPGALTPFAVVARAAALEEWALQKLEPEGFRTEVHVRELDGKTLVTIEGIRCLARAVERRGYTIMAHSLRVLANQKETTPSRDLIAPVAKNSPVHPAWMDRADLA